MVFICAFYLYVQTAVITDNNIRVYRCIVRDLYVVLTQPSIQKKGDLFGPDRVVTIKDDPRCCLFLLLCLTCGAIPVTYTWKLTILDYILSTFVLRRITRSLTRYNLQANAGSKCIYT